MRIALVSTVSDPVRRDSFGSVEAWSWFLARELQKLGHSVTTFGCGESDPAGEFVRTLPGPYGAPGSYDDWELCEWVNLCRAVEQSERFDVLHTQAYLWGVPLQKLCRAPMLHTMHIVPDDNAVRLWSSAPETLVTGLTKQQWAKYPELHPIAVIPHGVEISEFTFRGTPSDYVLYLGRFTSGKGPLQAIEAARLLGLRIVLAGRDCPYFRQHVKPLVDGKSVEWVGFAGPADRNRLLGGARALVYPIQYPEAFGLVLVEAMLCGTPVAAMNYGAVPEVVEEGVSGFSTGEPKEFPAVLQKALTLDRGGVRRYAEARFSVADMARKYAEVYEPVAAGVVV